MKYQRFIFRDYQFDPDAKTLTLQYAIDQILAFTETYKFDFDFVQYESKTLKRALENLFFIAGVSYYKTYIPPEIIVEKGELDAERAAFFSKTYQRGLGEFWYVNNLDPKTPVNFPVNANSTRPTPSTGNGLLASVGGGKDSLLTIEMLRTNHENLVTWSLNHKSQLSPLVERIGLPHLWVERVWDPQLQELNKQDALNGHVPISAIFACVGAVVAILAGKKDIVMSNEQSANEPTLTYQDIEINHQYSKSQEFETDYQAILRHDFDNSIRYYSLLRPFSELRIAELFAQKAFTKYKDVFCSCNRAFTHGNNRMLWCGECPKCAFTFLILTPFVPREELENIWNGKNLLLAEDLETTYQKLLGIADNKPLDCVGEIRESRAAMNLVQQQYLELLHYHFELPKDYDWRTMGPSHMPEEMLRELIVGPSTASSFDGLPG
ncbi:endonuclease domain-containing protein [Candidatus Saccharibacteria bacterium]|nr:endonuclease domain-containing protein [Candidatus Saccharibacteria bacterium]